MAPPQRALPLPSTARRLRCNCRRRLQCMEPPMRRGWASHFAMLLSLDSTGQTLGATVSDGGKMIGDRDARVAIAQLIAHKGSRLCQLRDRVERPKTEGSDASQAE